MKTLLLLAAAILFPAISSAEISTYGLNLGGQLGYSANKQITFGFPAQYNTTFELGDVAFHPQFNVVSEDRITLSIGAGPVYYFGDGADALIAGEHWSWDTKIATSWRFARSSRGHSAWYLGLLARHDMNINHDQPVELRTISRSLTRVEARVQFAFLPSPPAPSVNYPPLDWHRVGFGLSGGAQSMDQTSARALQ